MREKPRPAGRTDTSDVQCAKTATGHSAQRQRRAGETGRDRRSLPRPVRRPVPGPARARRKSLTQKKIFASKTRYSEDVKHGGRGSGPLAACALRGGSWQLTEHRRPATPRALSPVQRAGAMPCLPCAPGQRDLYYPLARRVSARGACQRPLPAYAGRHLAVPADGGLRVDGEVDHGHLGVGRAAQPGDVVARDGHLGLGLVARDDIGLELG